MRNNQIAFIAFTATLADGLKQLNARTGVEHAIFADHDWTHGPAGRIDLFGCINTMLGRSIELHESFMFTHCGLMGLYMIPVTNVEPFTESAGVRRGTATWWGRGNPRVLCTRRASV